MSKVKKRKLTQSAICLITLCALTAGGWYLQSSSRQGEARPGLSRNGTADEGQELAHLFLEPQPSGHDQGWLREDLPDHGVNSTGSGNSASTKPSLLEGVEVNKTPEASQAGVPDFMEAGGGAEEWAAAYKDASAVTMHRDALEITAYLKRQTAEELMRRRVEGEFEVLSTNGSIPFGEDSDNDFFPGLDVLTYDFYGVVKRFRIPEAQYPDLWELGRKARWLEEHGRPKHGGFWNEVSLAAAND